MAQARKAWQSKDGMCTKHGADPGVNVPYEIRNQACWVIVRMVMAATVKGGMRVKVAEVPEMRTAVRCHGWE